MTEQKRGNLVSKIQKLFALSKSANEHEASLAIQKAHELMVENGIDELELLENKDIQDIIEIDFELSSRFQTPSLILARNLAETFFCEALIIKTKTGYHKIENKVRFIGAKSDISVASYVYSYILGLTDTKSKDYFESIKNTKSKWSGTSAKKVKNDFSLGFISGVCDNLKKIRLENEKKDIQKTEMTNALVVLKNKLVNDYINENFNKMKEHKKTIKYDPNHYNVGLENGIKTGIYRGISAEYKNNIQIAN